MKKYTEILVTLFSFFVILGGVGPVYAQIQNHPACPSGQPACYPTRQVTTHSCTQCTKAWLCSGNPSINCCGNYPTCSYGSGAKCVGSSGPCRFMCTPGSLRTSGCKAISQIAPCNTSTSPPTCRTIIAYTECSWDSGSNICNITNKGFLGCCGPGSGPYCGDGSCNGTETCATCPGDCGACPACNCGNWVNGVCGGGSCTATQREQTRTCVPAGCEAGTQCIVDPTCTPPSCTVDLLPATATTTVGSSVTLTASVTIGSGTVDRVNFTSANTGILTVSPASDSTVVYQTQATGVVPGSTTVSTEVIMGGVSTCADSAGVGGGGGTVVDVTPVGPWWQVKDADVTAYGDLVSLIPASCSLPVCNPVFGLKGLGGFPGVPVYGGVTADFAAGTGTGNAAEVPYNWLVNSLYSSSRIYNYDFFERQIPSDVTFTEITTPTVNGGDFNSGGAPSRGYVWYHYNGATLGDMTISGEVNLTGSRRAVLLVDGADLYITGRINIQSPGNGFFMVVVGKDANGLKGNIIVDPSVSHPTSPGLEGIFVAEGEFRTGVGTSQLWVRGSVAAYDGFLLERDLQAGNSTKPAELFEYAPDIISVFPQVFTTRRMRWKEVAP